MTQTYLNETAILAKAIRKIYDCLYHLAITQNNYSEELKDQIEMLGEILVMGGLIPEKEENEHITGS